MEPVTSMQAREWTQAGKRIRCVYCGRQRFCKPQSHVCRGNLRKRHLRWLLLDEPRPMPVTT